VEKVEEVEELNEK